MAVTTEALNFVQRCQVMVGWWPFQDYVANISGVWNCLQSLPPAESMSDRMLVASSVTRIAQRVLTLRTEAAMPLPDRCCSRRRVQAFLTLLRIEHKNHGTLLRFLAKRVGVTQCRLSRLLASETGLQFHVHLGGWRTLSSTLLLGSRKLAMKAIAYDVGYAGPAEFDRQFKSWTKMTPSDFRTALYLSEFAGDMDGKLSVDVA